MSSKQHSSVIPFSFIITSDRSLQLERATSVQTYTHSHKYTCVTPIGIHISTNTYTVFNERIIAGRYMRTQNGTLQGSSGTRVHSSFSWHPTTWIRITQDHVYRATVFYDDDVISVKASSARKVFGELDRCWMRARTNFVLIFSLSRARGKDPEKSGRRLASACVFMYVCVHIWRVRGILISVCGWGFGRGSFEVFR